MKRKTFFIASIFLIMIILSGCVYVPTLSDEESNKIANYSTALLLKYDANYKSRLVDTVAIEAERAIIEAEEQKKIEEEAAIQEVIDAEKVSDEPPVDDVVVEDIYVDIAAALGLEGAALEYAYIEVLDKYPKEEMTASVSSVESTEGNSLLVVHFTLTNLLETSNEVSIYDTKSDFRMEINNSTQRNVFTTFLLNDLTYYSGVLGAGKMQDLVLISEIKEAESVNIQNLSMIINVNGDSIKTKLQ